MTAMIEAVRDLFIAGGWVMWPLAALSVVSVALSLERALFWWGMKRAGRGDRGGWIRRMAGLLGAGRFDEARAIAREDGTVYGTFVLAITPPFPPAPAPPASVSAGTRTAESAKSAEAAAAETPGSRESKRGDPGGKAGGGMGAVEEVRPAIERWGVTMSTIITAAPMLGILGTVLGIIESFQLLGAADDAVTDPTQVAGGIAEALITTAFGLIVALVTLFPYNVFRAAADRCFGRLETLIESGEQRVENRD